MKKMEKRSCSAENPSFIKHLSGNFKKNLQIPPAFTIKDISEELRRKSSQQAIKKGPSGCCWHVKLNMSSDRVYLQDGWETFVRDQSLQENETLLFTYDGSMQFRVTIFGINGGSRNVVSSVKASQESTDMKYLDPSHLSQHLENLELPESDEPHPSDVAEQRMRKAECSGRCELGSGNWYSRPGFRR